MQSINIITFFHLEKKDENIFYVRVIHNEIYTTYGTCILFVIYSNIGLRNTYVKNYITFIHNATYLCVCHGCYMKDT